MDFTPIEKVFFFDLFFLRTAPARYLTRGIGTAPARPLTRGIVLFQPAKNVSAIKARLFHASGDARERHEVLKAGYSARQGTRGSGG